MQVPSTPGRPPVDASRRGRSPGGRKQLLRHASERLQEAVRLGQQSSPFHVRSATGHRRATVLRRRVTALSRRGTMRSRHRGTVRSRRRGTVRSSRTRVRQLAPRLMASADSMPAIGSSPLQDTPQSDFEGRMSGRRCSPPSTYGGLRCFRTEQYGYGGRSLRVRRSAHKGPPRRTTVLPSQVTALSRRGT